MGLQKKIWMWNLSISTLLFLGLTIYRMTLSYNENGVYFHEGVTYNSDAVPAYATSFLLFLAATIALKIFWKESEVQSNRK